MGLDFVRVGIAEDLFGKKDGEAVPADPPVLLHDHRDDDLTEAVPDSTSPAPRSSRVPLVLAGIAYVTWIYAGLRKHPSSSCATRSSHPGATGPLPSS
jgi:F-type H+-transporting ATPase subunit a